MSTVKDEAIKLRQNIDAVYEAGQNDENKRFWDAIFQDGKRENFMYGFGGESLLYELHLSPYIIRPVDPATGTPRAATGMFQYANRYKRHTIGEYDMTEICKKIDMSQARGADGMFYGAYVKNVTLDLSNVETMSNFINSGDGGSFVNITLTVSDKCIGYNKAFYYVRSTTHLIFTEGSVIAADISFSYSNLLDDESIQSIINALQDRTGQTALKVTFHTDVVNRLTDAQLAQIAAKNWQLG